MRHRWYAAAVAAVLALLSSGWAVAGQTSESTVRVDRLASLAEVWASVKYFHPYLGYREDIDWDAALLAVIPKVRAANTREEYGEAVDALLAALGDPVTRIIPLAQSSVRAGPTSVARPPSYLLTPEGTIVVSSGDYSDPPDMAAMQATLVAAADDLPRARGIVFDLRSHTALPANWRGLTSLVLRRSPLAGRFSSMPYTTPVERVRARDGFQIRDGRRIAPAPGTREDLPTVVLVNQHSDIAPEMLALQAEGKAVVVSDGDVTDERLVTTTALPLAESLVARIRLGELVFTDGVRRFEPDVVVTASTEPPDDDLALVEAMRFIENGLPVGDAEPAVPARGVFLAERPYDESPYPALEQRLLAAFRLWAVVGQSFAYMELMTEGWGDVLKVFIPRMEDAESALAYHLAVAEMVTHIHDSHGVVQSSALAEHFGMAAPPVRVRMIEGVPVVTGFRNEAVALGAGIEIGDVILTVDGEPAGERITRYATYVAASTPHAHLRDVVDRRTTTATTGGFLYGPPNSDLSLSVRGRSGTIREVRLSRTAAFAQVLHQRTGEILSVLPGNIGYVDLDRLTEPMLDQMFDLVEDSRAIIFDMRGYPRGARERLAAHLTSRGSFEAAIFENVLPPPPGDSGRDLQQRSTTITSVQTFRTTDMAPYEGRTVMLIDERTQSAAEHLGLILKAANGTTFVGSHTAGANGNVFTSSLPGGIRFSFSGVGVRHADGRQLQRVGLVPDVEAKPTVDGIQDGRDEVLEAAIEHVERIG